MGNLNKVMLIGHLGQNPEKRITPTGQSVVSVSLATTEKYNDKNGVKQEKTEWHRVVFWNKQAELLEQYCRKGSQLYIEGALQTREWMDKDNNKRWSTEVICRSMQFLDSKGSSQDNSQRGENQGSYGGQNQSQTNQSQTNQSYNGPTAPPSGDFINDDIPF